ncbi:MAG: hypothetical protein HKK66_03250 [Chlorobiaceae bacterium]|nr:hypothetical protein [Chlorobiaceae bacterium]
MKTVVLFTSRVLEAGATSTGVLVDVNALGASGDFGLEVDSDAAVVISYKASAVLDTPAKVDGGGILLTHDGSGRKCYWPAIGPFAKIWIYATAPAGSAATVTATLNVY